MAIVIKLEGNNPQEEQKSNSKHHERLFEKNTIHIKSTKK
jgi:hypothetical protein